MQTLLETPPRPALIGPNHTAVETLKETIASNPATIRQASTREYLMRIIGKAQISWLSSCY
jgi:hypothetical protein